MSVTCDHSRVKDTQLMPGTLLSTFCPVRTVRNVGQTIFAVLPCANENRFFNVGHKFYSELFHILQEHILVHGTAETQSNVMFNISFRCVYIYIYIKLCFSTSLYVHMCVCVCV
jgi:hypothetical protein